MTIATSVQKHLVREGVSFELIEHTRVLDSTHSAQSAHIPGAGLGHVSGTDLRKLMAGALHGDISRHVQSACLRRSGLVRD